MKVTIRILAIACLIFLGHAYFNESISLLHQSAIAHEQSDRHETSHNDKADLIIFSFDRPLQLYALLESVEKYMIGLSSIQVIYRASTDNFEQAYQTVKADFSSVSFTRQGSNPRADFKPLTVHALTQSPSAYVLFAVDDIIVTDHIDCKACIHALDKYNAYGFYLRMGKNLTECYAMNRAQQLPQFQEVESGILQWCFAQSELDWNYPHTVDMTLYRKKDIESQFKQMQYWAPNPLEATWAGRAGHIMHRTGLCYAHTKMVNVPLNSVQLDFTNRNMEFMTSKQLLELFNQNKKIDISPLYRINNQAAHMAYAPTFVERMNG